MEDLAETTRRRRWLKERASALRKKIRTRFVLKRMERHAMDEYRTRTSVRRVSNAPFIQPPWADEVQWASARIEVVRLERAARDMVSFAIRGSGAGIDRLLRNAAILLACRPLDLPSEAHPLVKDCASTVAHVLGEPFYAAVMMDASRASRPFALFHGILSVLHALSVGSFAEATNLRDAALDAACPDLRRLNEMQGELDRL